MTTPNSRPSPWAQRVRRPLGAGWYWLRGVLGIPTVRRRRLRRFAALHRAAPTTLARFDVEADAPGLTLAIIVPMYGHAAFVGAALESVARQTCLPDEVILVNDGSPDNTGDVARAACALWPEPLRSRLRILDNPANQGQSVSLNRAVAGAASDLIMVLNDDDYLFHDAVELVRSLYVTHPALAMIGSTCVEFHDAAVLRAADRKLPGHDADGVPLTITHPADALRFRFYNDLNPTHSGCTFRKPAWDAVGGYAPRRQDRVVRFADRDFEMKINVLFPVGVSRRVPWAFWRDNSSVDKHLLT